MLYRREGSARWWGKFTIPGGRTARESSGTTDRVQAEEWYAHRKAALWREHRLGERREYSFAEVAGDWIETHAKFKGSYETDRVRMKVLLQYIDANRLVRDIKTSYLTTVRDEIRTKRKFKGRALSPASVNQYLNLISMVLHHAHLREWLDGVPVIPLLPVQKKLPVILTGEQVQLLLLELPKHLLQMAVFSLATGLRQSNVRLLRWDQIDFTARLARVPPSAAKAGETITVPLSDEAIELLRGLMGQHPTYVFIYRGEPISGGLSNTAWYAACARAGVAGLKWHHLRATWATWLAAAGVPEAIRQKMGGWKTPGMAATYTNLAGTDIAPYRNVLQVRLPDNSGHSADGDVTSTEQDKAENVSVNSGLGGVADGIRTHDNWNHNPHLRPINTEISNTYQTRRPRKAG